MEASVAKAEKAYKELSNLEKSNWLRDMNLKIHGMVKKGETKSKK